MRYSVRNREWTVYRTERPGEQLAREEYVGIEASLSDALARVSPELPFNEAASRYEDVELSISVRRIRELAHPVMTNAAPLQDDAKLLEAATP